MYYLEVIFEAVLIISFADRRTERFFEHEGCPPEWLAIRNVLVRKLTQLHGAGQLFDLASPPGNRLEKLAGDRVGQWSLRVNDQWRICFEWSDQGPKRVEIVDYH
jgi:proteic killer suppression protein